MTTKQVDKWLVVAMAVALLSGRAAGQQIPSPDKGSGDKKVETKAPREGQPPVPTGPERRRPGVDPYGPDNQRPGADPYRGDDLRPGGGFRRPGGSPGGRDPDGPSQFGQPPPRDGRWPREGGAFSTGPPQDMKTYDPEMYELESKDQDLERQTQELSQQLRRAPRDQRDALKKQLHDLVLKHFDARQARRDLQLKRLETELERMRDSMKKRVETRDQIIGRRVAELAGEQNEFDF